jgi:hypothetical protein
MQIDVRVAINDTLLTKIIMFYVATVIALTSIISIKNTLFRMKNTTKKDTYHKFVWILFLLAYLSYALVFILVGMRF